IAWSTSRLLLLLTRCSDAWQSRPSERSRAALVEVPLPVEAPQVTTSSEGVCNLSPATHRQKFSVCCIDPSYTWTYFACGVLACWRRDCRRKAYSFIAADCSSGLLLTVMQASLRLSISLISF